MTKKTVIILNRPKGARLANQLWNFISVYAYCLEKGYECKNYSFFEDKKQESKPNSIRTYYNLFDMPSSRMIRFLLWLHVYLSKISQKPRLYYRYVEYIKRTCPGHIIYSPGPEVFNLPPTGNNDKQQMTRLLEEENNTSKKIYLDGWLFRNPVGIEKYRKEIIEYFKPTHTIIEHVRDLIAPLQKKYKKLVGVHIRQGDYKKLFANGKYYFNEEEVRQILDGYLVFTNSKKKDVIFLICSDEKTDTSYFLGLNYIVAKGNEAEDLFTLASCDIIIGSRSTYGPWAALYGNIPFIMFEKTIDWSYYRQKDMSKYFNNEKCGLATG